MALRIAEGMGLLAGRKTKHFSAKVSPRLFQAAGDADRHHVPGGRDQRGTGIARHRGRTGLAKNWGVLADAPPDLLDTIDI